MEFVGAILDKFIKDRREDDIFDRLNYKATPLLLLLFTAINTTKLYIGQVINCFSKAEFKRGWNQYAHDYCYAESTYFLRPFESDDLAHYDRGQRYISYYQWVPFILPLQALTFYIPHLAFRSFNWISGYHVYSVIHTAVSSNVADRETRKDNIQSIARILYRASKIHHKWMNLIEGQSFVAALYLVMKFSYLILIICHMIIYKTFIGNYFFGFNVLAHGMEWRDSGLFPRVTMCDFEIEKFGQPMNYTLECVLPLNMFNEKIFMFLYFWMLTLFTLNLWSIWAWWRSFSKRRTFFNELLVGFAHDSGNWRQHSAASPSAETTPFLPNGADEHGVTRKNTSFGKDMRLVLGLLKEHAGVVTASAVFKEVCSMREAENIPLSSKSSSNDS